MLTMTACSQVPKIIDINTKPDERPELILPEIDQFKSKDVKWVLVTKDNAEQILNDLESNNKPIVLFSLDDDNYQNLTLNMADLMKLIQQQKAIIAAYKGYYKDENTP